MSLIEKMQSRLDDALLERAAAHERMNRTEILLDEANDRARMGKDRADKAESELFALGIQCDALKERLRLATDTVRKMRVLHASGMMPDRVARAMNDILYAFDAVPGDVGARRIDDTPANRPARLGASYPLPPPPDTRPRYASGEVPMVGDVFAYEGTEVTIHSIGAKCVYDSKGDDWNVDDDCTLVRRAAPPAPDLLARAVALLREHAYDVRVRDFLADFDAKGGV